jgi:GR25 family glycosyltransferase involved in LPS biosynthesis
LRGTDVHALGGEGLNLSISALGVWLAHMEAWKVAATGNAEWSIVVEDDLAFLPTVDYVRWHEGVPGDADIVHLNYTWMAPTQRSGRGSTSKTRGAGGAGARQCDTSEGSRKGSEGGRNDSGVAVALAGAPVWGQVAYLVSRASARRMLGSVRGRVLEGPIDQVRSRPFC